MWLCKRYILSVVFLFVLFLQGLWMSGNPAFAGPISQGEARSAAQNWLGNESLHMGEALGKTVKEVVAYKGGNSGSIGYYLVILDKGWIILPADDDFWPVQKFGPGKMTKEDFEASFWYHTTRFDGYYNTRTSSSSSPETSEIDVLEHERSQNASAWSSLLSGPSGDTRSASGARIGSLEGDVWVSPLLRRSSAEHWGLGWPFAAETTTLKLTKSPLMRPNHTYPVGSTPLAMGQVMLYHMTNNDLYDIPALYSKINVSGMPNVALPVTGYQNVGFLVSHDKYPGTKLFKRDIANPSSYRSSFWTGLNNAFPANSDINAVSQDIADVIAPFLRDVGVALNTSYRMDGTAAYLMTDKSQAYGFHSYVLHVRGPLAQIDRSGFTTDDKKNMILTNLDSGLPVIASFMSYYTANTNGRAPDSTHSCVVDGYGFARKAANYTNPDAPIDYSLPYYHVNTGQSRFAAQSDGTLSWERDDGGWSYNLQTEFFLASDEYDDSHSNAAQAMQFNLVTDLNYLHNKPNDTTLTAGWTPSMKFDIISGRVVSASQDVTFNPGEGVAGAEVQLSYPNSGQTQFVVRGTTTTNEKGIYSFIVPVARNVRLKVTSPDMTYNEIELERKKLSASMTQYTWNANTGSHSSSTAPTQAAAKTFIGNQWGVNFEVLDYLGVETLYEDQTTMLDNTMITMTTSESTTAVRESNYAIIPIARLLGTDYEIPKVKVLVIGSDLHYSEGHAQYEPANAAAAAVKVLQYVNDGGVVIVSGKSDTFIRTLGQSVGLTFETNRPYGSTTKGVFQTARVDIVNSVGNREFWTNSEFTQAQNTLIDLAGDSRPLTVGYYVFQVMDGIWDTIGLNLITSVEFPYGENGGYVYYFNHELTLNHDLSNGIANTYSKSFVNYLLTTAVEGKSERHPKIRTASVNNAALPRGVVQNVFHHQVGDRRSSIVGNTVNKVSFGVGITSPDIDILRIDDDLVLDVRGTLDQVKVPNWFAASRGTVSEVVFENGDILSAEAIKALAVISEPEVDYTPISIDMRVDGTDGDDTLIGNDLKQLFLAGEGDDFISTGPGQNVVYYRDGDGDDTLEVGRKSEADRVVLRMHTDITSADIKALRNGDDLAILVGSGSVTVRGWYEDSSNKLNRVEFYDGTIWDDRDLEKLVQNKELVGRRFYAFEDLETNLPDFTEKTPPREETADDSASTGSGGCDSGYMSILAMLFFAVVFFGRKATAKGR